ncbi:MAG: succinate dehydrogenase, cytochrome b556 subunit [Gammaproteobacteria bacterium]|nr:succinate dehydrogenase, cytochrome b556 subunit [Gammaproteobacteria bacterium]
MKPNRPVNLDLGTIALPLPAKASILHRVSGVALVVAVAVLLYLFDLSLSGEAGFARAAELLATTPAKLVIWAVLAALIYHCVAGVKHLLMDLGIGESLQGGITAARITFAVAAVLIVLAGVWVW